MIDCLCSISILPKSTGARGGPSSPLPPTEPEKLYSKCYGEVSDYTHKDGAVRTDILLPPQALAGRQDSAALWNAAEKAERGGKAQLAYSFDIALQNEFLMEENIALARQFVSEQLVGRGRIVDFAIHQTAGGTGTGQANPGKAGAADQRAGRHHSKALRRERLSRGNFTQKMKSPGKTEFNITLFPAIHTHFLIIFFADKFEILSLAQRCQSIFLNMLRHDFYHILEIF